MATQQSLIHLYEQLAENKKIQWDDDQYNLVQHLDELSHKLIKTNSSLNKVLSSLKLVDHPRGFYLWGGVGRGKTFIMDLFFDAIPIQSKTRLHFHRFMEQIHDQLKEFAGQQDPLELIAESMRKHTRLLCFDEFFVTDITDAMILGELLTALFKRGVVLVATSNIPPDQLYANGLQRERFLPAIEQIKQHCQVMNVDSGNDYRLRTLEQAEIYHYPLDEAADKNLQFSFNELGTGEVRKNHELMINHRPIHTIQRADGVAWFEFSDLCQTERNAADYIELSRLYHTVLLANVPTLDDTQNDAVRRLIALVDEFYERQVKLIISAAEPLEKLYTGTAQAFAFERTQSRLIEMQTHHYLSRPHLP